MPRQRPRIAAAAPGEPTGAETRSLSTARLVMLSSGDFACNLYWQSLSFFLLFFYTDVVRLSPGQAGAVLALGAAWDGVADALVGVWAERAGRYRRFLALGAAPLGLAFAGLYLVRPAPGGAGLALVLAAHLAFRSLYAVVNIPFAALSVRVTQDSRERSRIAAYRMLFGTAAALTVALATKRLAGSAGGSLTVPGGYGLAAVLFALVGTAILLLVARTAPPEARAVRPASGVPSLASRLGALRRNRAFVTLNLASAASVVGGSVLTGSVIYYFTYVARAPAAGPATMAWMGVAGALAIPAWTRLRDAIGTRGLWLLNVALALLATALFAAAGETSVLAAQAYLAAMQAIMIGFVFAFWAMLPDTAEWGERHGGVRVEALAFGVASLLQKLAAGLAAGLLAVVYTGAGYRPGVAQAPETVTAIRATMLALPALAIALSALAMLANPLRRDTHARLRAELGRGEAA